MTPARADAGAPADQRRRPAPLPVRVGATGGLLLLAAVLVVTAVTVLTVRNALGARSDAAISEVVASFDAGPAAAAGDDAAFEASVRSWLSTAPLGREELAAVRLSDGTVLGAGAGMSISDIERASDLLASNEATSTRRPAGDTTARLVAIPIVRAGTPVGTLLVGASEQAADSTVRTVVRAMAFAGVGAILPAVLLGIYAVRRTLVPLSRIADEVASITASGDLTRRVAHHGTADEIGRLAGDFDTMMDRLESVFGKQREFLGDVSHELRTPLTVVRGQIELAQTNTVDDTTRRALSAPLAEMDRMARIVNDLLLLARLDEGLRLELEPTEVELVLSEAALRAGALGRELVVDVPAGVVAMADPERLLQVVTNLAMNAIQHAGPAATVTLGAVADDDTVRITVSDDGVGIPSRELATIFDRHRRGAGAHRSDTPGAGLGLAIARSLTSAMGGDLTAHSSVGHGATFTVSLPAASTAGLDFPAPSAERRGITW